MALAPGDCIDVVDIQFKLQSKIKVFQNDLCANKGSSLLATASTLGLVFYGLPAAELHVTQLLSLDGDREVAPRRVFPLPSPAFQLAISCDNSLLAVDVLVNGVPFLYVYRVDSFLTNNVQKVTEIRISPNENVHCTQIIWNPVINNMFALLTESGGLCVYHIQDKGIEFYSIDKTEVAQSACWSPKGKQIVVGFGNGRLVQYKQDLKPAKTLPCPPSIVDGPFDVIALQWLSTYQFAAVFLRKEENSVPALHIINAPKGAPTPTYVNYDDICFSQSGPRKTQVFLIYIQQWNILLMASANSMEVGILGTSETGETPTWCQWVTTDNARAELPLTAEKQETFPIGFVLETGCTKRLVIGETEYPVMPMVHILSTHGFMLSFTILNLKPTYVDICSPPRPINPGALSLFVEPVFQESGGSVTQIEAAPAQPVPTATSTPTIPKSKSFFSPPESKSATNLFGQGNASTASIFGVSQPQASLPFGSGGLNIGSVEAQPSLFGGQPLPAAENKPLQTTNTLFKQPFGGSTAPVGGSLFGNLATVKPTTTVVGQVAKETSSKPLITVLPTYTQTQQQQQADPKPEPTPKSTVKSEEDNKIIRIMITEEMQNIERDLKGLLLRSKDLNSTIGTSEESGKMIKTLDGLQDWGDEALENTDTLASEIQQLRLGINETFQMVAEAKSKFAMYHDANQLQFQEAQSMSLSNKRQVTRLSNVMVLNEAQVQLVDRQINAQWAGYEDYMKMNSRNRMHIPSLEGVYQTLSKLQEIIHTQVVKLSIISKKIGMKEKIIKIRQQNLSYKDSFMESLTDSLISMSIADQVKDDASKLSFSKLEQLKEVLNGRKIVQIKPSRPNRPGLNSEVVKEKLLQSTTVKKKAPIKRVEQPVATKATPPAFSLGKPTSQTSPFASVAPTMPAKPIPIVAPAQKVLPSFEQVVPKPGLFQMKPVIANEPKVSIATTGDSIFASSLPAPSLSFGTGSSSFGATKSINEPSTTISFGSVSKQLFGGSKLETTAAAMPTLSFGAATTKPVTDFSFAAISSASAFGPGKPVEIVSTPSFGAFEALPIKPTPTISSSFGTPVAPLQLQAQPQAKPAPAMVPVKEKQHLVINPVAVTLEKKSEEFTTISKSQNKENSGPTLIEKQPLLPLPSVTTNIEQNPPTIASPVVVSSADIKKPIATTSSSFSFGAAFSAANAVPPTTTIPSVSATFSFAPPPPVSAPASTASSFSFTSAAEKITPAATVVDQNVNVSSADNLFQGFNICSPTSTAPANTSSIFGTSLSFSGAKTDSTTSIFGGGFGSTPATTAPPSSVFGTIGGNAPATTTSGTSFFGSMGASSAVSTGASIFALPKPEQSVFGAPSTPFSAQPTQQPTQGSSIFGGGNTAAPFGGSAFSSPAGGVSSGSIFSNNQPTSGSSIFASPSAFSSPTSGGSIFGNNNAGQSGGSIFGGGANQAPAFGQSATFSSPPGGAFGQAGFGAPASFGAPPSFGQTGGFGQMPLSAGLSSPTQSNTLFEQLGASSAQGMTFGNLAQSANTEKPVFGGQQFSSWR